MDLESRIKAFAKLGNRLKEYTGTFYDDESAGFQKILSQALINNPWFTKENQFMALSAIAEMLDEKNVRQWISTSNLPVPIQSGKPQTPNTKPQTSNPKQIGVIMAGNIPAVGFHDMLSVLITGNVLKAKCSSDDKILLPWISELLFEMEPAFRDFIFFIDRMKDVDAVIATGSNNSSRYFDYYFSKIPNIIRKNRNAVAVLSGNETAEELKALGKDIFSYFGLGCRNVSKMYLPKGYDLGLFFRAIESYSGLMNHNKYMNNYDYNHSVYLLNDIKFLTNNFLIVKQDNAIPTPVSVLNYEFYDGLNSLKTELTNHKEKIQCIVSNWAEIENAVPFGKAQQPELWDYADGVNTIKFLGELK